MLIKETTNRSTSCKSKCKSNSKCKSKSKCKSNSKSEAQLAPCRGTLSVLLPVSERGCERGSASDSEAYGSCSPFPSGSCSPSPGPPSSVFPSPVPHFLQGGARERELGYESQRLPRRPLVGHSALRSLEVITATLRSREVICAAPRAVCTHACASPRDSFG